MKPDDFGGMIVNQTWVFLDGFYSLLLRAGLDKDALVDLVLGTGGGTQKVKKKLK